MKDRNIFLALSGWLLAACLAVLPVATPVYAQALDFGPAPTQTLEPALLAPAEASKVEVSLAADRTAVQVGKPLKLGVHFKMAPGWHIYFRNPGEIGKPTTVEFTIPPGSTAGALEWRQPSKFTDFGVTAFGYEHETTIATNVDVQAVPSGASDMTFRAHVTWLVCENSCIPGSADIELTLPVVGAGSAAPNTVNAELFAGLLPGDAITVSTGRVLDGNVEVESAQGASLGLLAALLFAFIGGLILNLMPCVLPVISLKILSFVHQSGKDSSKVVFHGLWYTAGTLATFAALALLVVAMRSAGQMVGWGFQFQSPLFLVGLATIVLAMSLSMFGLFYLNVRSGQGLAGLSAKNGYSGSFFTGVLATVLATPCSAPFLGTAIGFAFAQPAAIIVAIFLTIGMGLAAPYLVLSAKPSWLKRIPKPGAWMETFKQTMGFLMLGSVVWLVSIIAQQVGAGGVGSILAYLLAVSFAAFLWSHLAGPNAGNQRKLVVGLTLAAALGAAFFVFVKPVTDMAGVQTSSQTAGPVNAGEQVPFQPFVRADLDKHLASGKVVFIDFTAQWCLTCKVNEARAINTPAVRATVDRLGVVAIKADWTNPNDEIARLLSQLGRSSVPTYVVFPADPSQKPILLSEMISEQEVIDALQKAARSK